MLGYFIRGAAIIFAAGTLAACASSNAVRLTYDDRESYGGGRSYGISRSYESRDERPAGLLQCVAYARERSGIGLSGDANTWWDAAAGRYERSATPQTGAVIVLTGYASDGRGHLAVVSRVVSDREIRIDHANWFDDGRIYLDDRVADVSHDNDWSVVRVWNARTHAWGMRQYHVRGFIGPGREGSTYAVAQR
jgi:surface antigen